MIDVKVEHRHGRLKGGAFSARAALGRSLEGSGELLRAWLRDTPCSKSRASLRCMTAADHFFRFMPTACTVVALRGINRQSRTCYAGGLCVA